MGDGSLEETHIKVDTGHIMPGKCEWPVKWSSWPGSQPLTPQSGSSRLEYVNADRLLYGQAGRVKKENLSNKEWFSAM